jgi:hypothetical protein
MVRNLPDKPTQSEILIYQTEDGRTRIRVRLEDETVWLSQKLMAELFQKDVRTINEHIRNIFDEGELSPESVIRKFRITAADGKSYETNHYDLDVVISVGYRVKSHRGTQFRMWATQRLREYIIKGFALDDERLKQAGGGNYFDELLARIRDIRASEKVFWRKVLDIYATSIDYDPNTEISRRFFQIVQNKLHWAAHGHTAAEIIAARADASKPYMGLTSWSGSRPTQDDVRRMGTGMKICVSYDRCPVRVVPSIPKKGRVRPALTIHPPYDTPLFEGKSKKAGPEALTLTLQEQISGNNPVSPD